MTTIVTWNVNSVNARLPIVTDWLRTHKPDILLLQELKCIESSFPHTALEDLGYNCAVLGQKTYNGVAILSKCPIEDIVYHFDGCDDSQARYIEAFTGDIRVASVYVPNGQAIDSDKYIYKLKFLEGLHRHLDKILQINEPFVLGGDFNVAPYAIDMHDPALSNTDDLLCSQAEQDALRRLLHMGFTDTLRTVDPDNRALFTWWDYRQGSFDRNKGYRIDHILLSPQAADLFKFASVDTNVRALNRTSDHSPVICQLNSLDKILK